MILPEVYRENTPLSERDCFVVFERRKTNFTFPLHIHPEYEINFVSGASGALRIIGDSQETIKEKDLVFIANRQLRHAWMDGECTSKNIHEITIQFHPSLFENYLYKNQFQSIKRLFECAAKGVSFSAATIEKIQPLLQVISMEKDSFYAVMRLWTLVYELSKCTDYKELSTGVTPEVNRNTALLNRLYEYTSIHLAEPIHLEEVAAELNMSRSTFARFLNTQIQMNFTDFLLDRRIKTAIVKLKSGLTNSEVAVQCGFNSLSYFYRVFKRAMGVNPTEFRNNCRKQQVIV